MSDSDYCPLSFCRPPYPGKPTRPRVTGLAITSRMLRPPLRHELSKPRAIMPMPMIHAPMDLSKHPHTDATDETYMLTAIYRTDFYQTPSSVIASFFLKKIDKSTAKVVFTQSSIQLDLPTSDSPPKRYRTEVPLFGGIDPEKTTYKVLGTKLEVTLAKAEVSSWPVLRADDRLTGEILQVGRAGKVQ